MKLLSAFFLSLALSLPSFGANTIKTPTIFDTGSSLTIRTGVVVTFSPGSIVNFTGATVTGLPSATGATIPNTGSILKGDGAGNGIAADATFINGVINSTVAPIFSNISARPTDINGYGILDAQPLNGNLTALAALSGDNVIYYRNAANTWLPITIGTNLTFTGGTLNATGGGSGGGDASTNTATSVDGEVVLFSGTAGKTLKRSTASGISKLASGVQGTATAGTDYVAPTGALALAGFSGITGNIGIVNGGTGVTALGTGLQALRTNAAATGTEWYTAGDALIGNSLAQFASTTSAQLAGVLSDETGTGVAVYNISPVFITPNLGTPSSVILTNGTGLDLATGVIGTLPIARIPTGTFATQVALGSDTRFPASVTGIRKSTGAGSTDTAALVDVDFVKASSGPITGGTTTAPAVWPAGKFEAVETTALAATGYTTLPAANAFAPGTSRRYVDTKTTGSFGRVFRRTGSDTINGASADVAPFIAGATGISGNKSVYFTTDGISNWTLLGPGGATGTAAAYGILNGAAIDLWAANSPTAPTFSTSVTTPLLNATVDLALTAAGTITMTPGASNVIAIKQFVIADPADPSKRVKEVVSSVASGVTRSNFHPDADTSAVVSNQTAPAGQWFNGFANGAFNSVPIAQTDIVPNEFVIDSDANATIPNTGLFDSVKLSTPLTGLRTFTFPAAGNYSPGETVRFYSSVDSNGNIARVNSPTGIGDNFNGQSSIDISNAFFNRTFVSDGLTPGNWTVSLGGGSGGTAAQPYRVITPAGNTYTIVPDPNATRLNAHLLLTNATNSINIPNPIDGMPIELTFVQDNTGGRTITLPTASRTASGGGGLVTLTSAGNAVDRLKGSYDGAGGYFLWDAPILNETSAALPAAPTSLAATGISASQVNLAWTDNATNENAYLVERAPTLNATTGFVQLTSLDPNSAAYSDFSTTALSPYTYRLRAQNTGGYSAYSNTATLTTASGAPNADLFEWHFNTGSGTSIVSTVGPGGTMTYPVWTNSTQSGTGSAFSPLLGMSTTTGTTVQPQGTTGATSYTYKVAAFKNDNTHNAASVVTIGNGNAFLDANNHNLITWNAVTGANYYEVYRTSAAGSTIGRLNGTGSGFTALTIDDIGLGAGGASSIPTSVGFATNVYTATASGNVTYGSVITTTFWINTTAFNASTTDIINGGGGSFKIQTLQGQNQNIQLTMPGTTGSYVAKADMTGVTGGWHLVTVIMDQVGSPAGTGAFTVYVDNNSTPRTLTTIGTNTHAGSPNFVAGAPKIGSQSFGSPVDDVRIYGRALTTTEITALNSGGAQ